MKRLLTSLAILATLSIGAHAQSGPFFKYKQRVDTGVVNKTAASSVTRALIGALYKDLADSLAGRTDTISSLETKAAATARLAAYVPSPLWSNIQSKPSSFAPSAHTHVATEVTQDGTHRFVTDAEKAAWNAGGSATIGTWTDATRPSSPGNASFGYNTTATRFEFYDSVGAAWKYLNSTAIPTLAAPASITPTAGNAQISESFATVTNATGYTVEVSSNNFSAVHGTASGSAPPITVSGLTNGTAYKSRVKATAPGYFTSSWTTTAGTVSPSVIQYFSFGIEGNSMEADEIGTPIGGGSTNSPGFYRPSIWQFHSLYDAGATPGANIITFFNEAAAGDDITTGGMLHANELARIRAAYVPGVRNICKVASGINNIQTGQTGLQAYNALRAQHDSIQAQGFETIATTITTTRHSGISDHPGKWIEVQDFNARVRAGYQTELHALCVVDREAIPPLKGYNAPLSNVWFNADQLHPSENFARAEGLLDAKAFNESILTATPAIVAFAAIDSTNALSSTDYHDGNNSKFTYAGDWSLPGGLAPSGSSLGAPWRNGDATYYSANNLPATVSWTTTTSGQIDEGVDIYFLVNGATNPPMLSIDGKPAIDISKTWGSNPNPPGVIYRYRVLGAAGAHTFVLTFSGSQFFDGITEYTR